MDQSSGSSPSKCGWTGPLPEFKQRGLCAGCGLYLTAGQVIRRRRQGCPAVEPAVPAPQPVRMDWNAEFPCDHLGPLDQSLPCGCADGDIVDIHQCKQSPGSLCVPIESRRTRLFKKHSATANKLRVCETCTHRCHTTPEPEAVEPNPQSVPSSIPGP